MQKMFFFGTALTRHSPSGAPLDGRIAGSGQPGKRFSAGRRAAGHLGVRAFQGGGGFVAAGVGRCAGLESAGIAARRRQRGAGAKRARRCSGAFPGGRTA